MSVDPSEIKNQDKSFVINTAPTVLSIRDVVVVLGVIFAIASSYVTSDNRHTVSEANIKNLSEQVAGLKDKIDSNTNYQYESKAQQKIIDEQTKNIQRSIDDLQNRVRQLENKR